MKAALAVFLVTLAACDTAAPERPSLSLSFTQQGPLNLDVTGVRVESRYFPPMQDPNVDHEFPVPPLTAMRSWASDRLRARGANGIAVLMIEDASARKEGLKTDRGVSGLFKNEQSDRYHVRVAATLEIRDTRGNVLATASTRASRSVTTPEGITLAERDRVWFEITDELMQDFDDEMERRMRLHMPTWLKY
ncbi:hypothetical protein [Magnetospira sp. QH-2]|uniref:hypothetical protein n=1 Tax=Magnetospira sp. (strain QH-2) TaxID=1288970 RepID=UPI0011DC8A14|nr:hypothetical protein [Magnetospira sp. QH-2]